MRDDDYRNTVAAIHRDMAEINAMLDRMMTKRQLVGLSLGTFFAMVGLALVAAALLPS